MQTPKKYKQNGDSNSSHAENTKSIYNIETYMEQSGKYGTHKWYGRNYDIIW